ncbi:discoidin domain-containing protein [Prevotella sp. KH2C16]|uniref:discoidin domain-containing protein n=1 Tax=Prevotella sp. KH2C16 TaxID=1855325 RepID=UPI0008F03446|nr:discoidin domain-containing protein [Prevotella sp. KH2C16]SFG29911.1 hypothetical protein SAMN05216383_10938 [Prevotella sp. KH2C16]
MKTTIFTLLTVVAMSAPMSSMAQNLVNYALPDYGEVVVRGDLTTNDWFHTGRINDNDFETKWLSCDPKEYENQWTKHWVIVDLGQERDIKEVDIYWAETANIYYVCLTNDEDVVSKVKAEAGKEEAVPGNIGEVIASSNYHDLGITAAKGETHKYPLTEIKKARYVVVFTTKDWIADTGYGVGIYELQVWGKPLEATKIPGISSLSKINQAYDLSGRKVKDMRKGVYIVNGRKVFK